MIGIPEIDALERELIAISEARVRGEQTPSVWKAAMLESLAIQAVGAANKEIYALREKIARLGGE
jgi:hypothetical protein